MRPPIKKSKEHAERSERIGEAITRIGPKRLMAVLGIASSWAIYKWRNKGFVPNEHLCAFCGEAGVQPQLVCDPAISTLVKPRVLIAGLNATKSRSIVNRVAK